jgi:hypothetical protein
MKYDVSHLTNHALASEIERLAHAERASTLALIVHLAEFDARKLHLAAAFPSLYRYCRAVLKLSEHEAYHRIVAARAGRRFPVILERLGSAERSLTTVRQLAPHLTRQNHAGLLEAARGRSKRQVQGLIARWFPKPDVPTRIRPVPATVATAPAGVASANATVSPVLGAVTSGNATIPSSAHAAVGSTVTCQPIPPGGGSPALSLAPVQSSSRRERPIASPPPSGPEAAVPLSPGRYEFHFTGPAAAYDKLQRAQELLRHAIPDGDVGTIFDRALSALITQVEKRRFARTDQPRPNRPAAAASGNGESRHVPAEDKRVARSRDDGRCTFRAGGRRCESPSGLEYHHVIPWEVGWPTTPDNLELRCRAHNGYEAHVYFGELRRAQDRHLEQSALPVLARTDRTPHSARAEWPLAGAG